MDRFGKIGIILVVVGSLINFFWNSNSVKIDPQQDPREETWVDQQGNLHVLGLTLNVTTLREAEVAMLSRTDPALYLYPHKDEQYHLVLEAYFPSITDHSKVILGLAANEEMILELEARATSPRMNRNGVGRMNLNTGDLSLIQQFTVEWVRLIPSTQLEVSMIEARFGAAASISVAQEGVTLMRYPEIGLQVIIREEGKDELVFFHPPLFVEGVRDLLVHAKIEAVI